MSRFVRISLCALAVGCEKPTSPTSTAEALTPVPAIAKPATPKPNPESLEEMQKVLAPALGAYQSGDSKALQAHFASAAPGMGDTEVVDRIFMQFYREKLGRLKAVRLSPKETTLDLDRGMLVYDAAFENGFARLSANFLRENGQLRLMQIRFEIVEE